MHLTWDDAVQADFVPRIVQAPADGVAPTVSLKSNSPVGSPAQQQLVWTLSKLNPGQSVTLAVPVKHDNAAPGTDPELRNTATVTFDHGKTATAEGVLNVVGLVVPPKVTKTADLASAVPGDLVTYTVTTQIDPTNTAPQYSVGVLDWLPRGLEFVEYLNATCTGCQGTPTTLTPASNAGAGTTTIGWLLGTARLVNDVQAISDQVGRGLRSADAAEPIVWQVILDVYAPASIGDWVWNDWNGNGRQDAGEPGLAGATVTITDLLGAPVLDSHGNPVPPVLTDETGRYLFENLEPGDYLIKVTPPAGVLASPTNIGGDPALDSNPSTSAVNVVAGQVRTDIDFGFFVPASIGDLVWDDLNGDGVQDPGEPGLAGVTVTITLPDGSTRTTVTDADGHYGFDGLPAGSFTITFTAPTGYLPSPTGSGSVGLGHTFSLEPGQVDDTLDAGFHRVPLPPIDPPVEPPVVPPVEPPVVPPVTPVEPPVMPTLPTTPPTKPSDKGKPGKLPQTGAAGASSLALLLLAVPVLAVGLRRRRG